MKNIKISYAALDTYRNFTRKNKDEPEIILRLKLLRNWLVSNTVYENEYIEVREYGNLRMTVAKESNVMNKIYNFKCGTTDEDKFNIIKEKAIAMNDKLGITYIRKYGYTIDGYEINARAYKNLLYEKEFMTYKDLLNECVQVIEKGRLVRVFNDKKIIKHNNWTITLTQDKYITNIRF